MIAAQARLSEFVDQQSGVSARMTIATMEALISNAERRAIANGDDAVVPRIIDLQYALPGITGKVELVFEGEQEGPGKVARLLVGKGVREVFARYFPNPLERPRRKGDQSRKESYDPYAPILSWFGQGNAVVISDGMTFQEYRNALEVVPALEELARTGMKIDPKNRYELATAMEFVLDGLHQNSKIARQESSSGVAYSDMLGSIFTGSRPTFDEEEEGY